MAGFEDAYKKYTQSGQGQAVAGMYDQQTQANVNSLKATYDQNLAAQQAAREQIGTTYQNSANNMQAQYERNRRNLNQQAAANGINTGAGSQQQLAMQNVWNRDAHDLFPSVSKGAYRRLLSHFSSLCRMCPDDD
jgi:hypothetical protein